MVRLDLTEQQVVELVRQLRPEGQVAVLEALGQERELWWQRMLDHGEVELGRICSQRGLDWQKMSEEDREAFIDDYLHERK